MTANRALAGRESDGALLGRLERRDRAALEALYARHARYVMGIAHGILADRSDAEEVVQDVFWELWKTQIRYDPARGRFTTWLYAIARNRALDRMRRRGRRSAGAPIQVPEMTPQADPERDAVDAERSRRVRGALAELSEEQRRALEFAFFAGLSHREIADRIGEPLGTVKSRIKRGMERLKTALGHGEGPA